jgi:hypothetical protein
LRQIIIAAPMPTAKSTSAWLVRFHDNSVVGVDAQGYHGTAAEVAVLVRKAAMRYSKTHPDGLLESVMVNLVGKAI